MGSVFVSEGVASEELNVSKNNWSIEIGDAFNEWWEPPVLGSRKGEVCWFAPPIVFVTR